MMGRRSCVKVIRIVVTKGEINVNKPKFLAALSTAHGLRATGTHREYNSSLDACEEALIETLGSSRARTLLELRGLS
jgi:hypothetical protein